MQHLEPNVLQSLQKGKSLRSSVCNLFVINGMLCHVKDLWLAWDQCSNKSDGDNLSTNDEELEVDTQMFDRPSCHD